MTDRSNSTSIFARMFWVLMMGIPVLVIFGDGILASLCGAVGYAIPGFLGAMRRPQTQSGSNEDNSSTQPPETPLTSPEYPPASSDNEQDLTIPTGEVQVPFPISVNFPFSDKEIMLPPKAVRKRLFVFVLVGWLFMLGPLLILANLEDLISQSRPTESLEVPLIPTAPKLAAPSDSGTPVTPTAIGNASAFSSMDCYRVYFPLALGIPESVVPPEVKFYCAAPWNIEVFDSVRTALARANFDIVEAAVRAAPDYKKDLLRYTLTFAVEQAENGPPGMGAVWYVYHVLPSLYALHSNSADAQYVIRNYAAEDTAALRAAATKIDWTQIAEHDGAISHGTGTSIRGKHLSDVSYVISSLAKP